MRRKVWLWVLGVVIAAGVVAFVRSRAGGDDLVVQLVDKETGKPLANAEVRTAELVQVPVLSELRFLPAGMRSRTLVREARAPAGAFRLRRISGSNESGARTTYFVVFAQGFRTEGFAYDGPLLFSRGSPRHLRIMVPAKGSVVIPLERQD